MPQPVRFKEEVFCGLWHMFQELRPASSANAGMINASKMAIFISDHFHDFDQMFGSFFPLNMVVFGVSTIHWVGMCVHLF